jgi:hypothetical protein
VLKRKDSKKMSEKELSTKRRATMNSRSAYEDDEMLRQAIEESKAGTLGKRVRDDSEEYANLRATVIDTQLIDPTGTNMVRSASAPCPAPHQRCRSKVDRHHSHLLTNPPQRSVPMAAQVERRFVVLVAVVLLRATTETRRCETVKKKSQLKEPKRREKGKLVQSAEEGRVEPTQDHVCIKKRKRKAPH